MDRYIGRCVDCLVERDLGIFGAVLIQGPKWCGKTTTAQRFAESSLSLSDPSGGFAALQLARLDPAQAIVGPTPRLVDEWQEEPKLWDAVRFECDARGGEPGQFILTGSATPRAENQPMHSGVGRIARLRMDTMTLFELGISSGAVSLGALLAGDPVAASLGSIAGIAGIADLLCRGGWPQAVGKTTADAMRIAAAYIDGVCESDVSRADGVKRDPVKVRALLSSLARNESTLAGMRSIGRDLGVDVSKNTITGYMGALRRINIVDDVPAWHPALRSPVKLRQGAKRHLADPSPRTRSRCHPIRRPLACSSNPSCCTISRFTRQPAMRPYLTTTTLTTWRSTRLSIVVTARGLPLRSSSGAPKSQRQWKICFDLSESWSIAGRGRLRRNSSSSGLVCRLT